MCVENEIGCDWDDTQSEQNEVAFSPLSSLFSVHHSQSMHIPHINTNAMGYQDISLFRPIKYVWP